MERHRSSLLAAVAIVVGLAVLGPGSSAEAGEAYDGYYNYLGNYPDNATLPWSDDVQGIAHTDDWWFVTNGNDDFSGLYKIHVSEDLAAGVIFLSISPQGSGLTAQHGFTKFKALDSYKNPFDGQWYLIIAVEGNGAGVALYTETMGLVGADPLPQSSVGWFAVDGAGDLYTGVNGNSTLFRYTLDWAALANTGNVVVSSNPVSIPVQDESGSPLVFDRLQGGAFTPEGDKLYVVTGFFGESATPHGIHVLDTTLSSTFFRRIRKSTQGGLFRFQWNPSCGINSFCEEPEGLTFWDLTNGRAPNIDGELHVLLLDNDLSTDEIFLKHYTKGIYVDASQGSGSGDPGSPFPTVQEAVDLAFEDMEIRIASGSYPQPLTLSKRLQFVRSSASGVVTLGQ